jgi:hypothetical protein
MLCVLLTFYEVDDDPDRFQYFLLEDASADDRTERRQLFRNLVDDEQLTGIVFRELHSVA